MAFFEHLRKMGQQLPTKILIFHEKRKAQMLCLKEGNRDVKKCGIREEGIGNTKAF